MLVFRLLFCQSILVGTLPRSGCVGDSDAHKSTSRSKTFRHSTNCTVYHCVTSLWHHTSQHLPALPHQGCDIPLIVRRPLATTPGVFPSPLTTEPLRRQCRQSEFQNRGAIVQNSKTILARASEGLKTACRGKSNQQTTNRSSQNRRSGGQRTDTACGF